MRQCLEARLETLSRGSRHCLGARDETVSRDSRRDSSRDERRDSVSRLPSLMTDTLNIDVVRHISTL